MGAIAADQVKDATFAMRQRRARPTTVCALSFHRGGCRREAFSVGLWSLPCKRRVRMDAGRKGSERGIVMGQVSRLKVAWHSSLSSRPMSALGQKQTSELV